MQRRHFLSVAGQLAGAALVRASVTAAAAGVVQGGAKRPQVSLTIDDPNVRSSLPWRTTNRAFLDVLSRRGLQAALFVCGMRVDDTEGVKLVGEWDDSGHAIGSHSYSHLMFLRRTPYDAFASDFVRNEPIVARFKHHRRLFRYPFLKEGDTADKRDRFRALLRDNGYRVGHVTIDTSDWYVDDRWLERRRASASATTERYRDFLVTHLIDRATYYRQLMQDAIGHDVPHTLLVHYRELTALSLESILAGFERAGWEWVDADRAFQDPVYDRAPATLPAGESLAWALASESGVQRLRWPGEDSVYEIPKLDALGL